MQQQQQQETKPHVLPGSLVLLLGEIAQDLNDIMRETSKARGGLGKKRVRTTLEEDSKDGNDV